MKHFTGFITLTILTFTLAFGGMVPPVQASAQTSKQKTTRTTTSSKGKKAPATSKGKKAAGKGGGTAAPSKGKGGTTKNAAKSTSRPRTADEVKKAKQQNASQLKETQRKIQLNTRETEKRLNQLSQLEGEIADCNTNIGRLSHNLESLNTSIKITSDSIQALDSRLETITARYVTSLRKAQGRSQSTSTLAFIFSSDSFSQAYRRMKALRQFSRWRKRRSEEIGSLRNELPERRQALSVLREEASAAVTHLNQEKSALVKKQDETTSLLGRLKSEGGELREIMNRRQREAEALDAELDRIIAEETARQERLRREKEEAERKARLEAERKARQEVEARLKAEAEAEAEQQRKAEAEAKAAREAEARAEQARKAEQEALAKAAEAERKARESADKEAKEQARKERDEAKKAEQARVKAEKEAQKKAKDAEREMARQKAKPVKHKGKNNRRERTADATEATEATQAPSAATAIANAPTLKSHSTAGGKARIAPESETPVGGNFEDYRGRLPFPVSGHYTIVKRFGRQKHPTLPHVETNNSGIDMQTDPGASVRCVFDGEVSAVFRPDGYNNVVVIRHGKFMTVYANLGSINVSTGQKIKAGESIGTVFRDAGDGNRSVLHFEIRNQRQKENPEIWLKR